MEEDNIIKKKAAKKKTTKKKNIDIKEDIEFKDLEGKFMLVTVGNNEKPANSDDINEIESKLLKLLEDNNINCAIFVTHHLVDIKIVK